MRVCTCAPARVRTLRRARQDQCTRTHVCVCVVIRDPALRVQRGVRPSTLRCGGEGLPWRFTVQQVAPEATFTPPSQPRFPVWVDPLPCVNPGGVGWGRTGDGEIEARGSQSCTWAEGARHQRAEWSSLGCGSPPAAPTYRPTLPCPSGGGYRQIGFIRGHAERGDTRARPPRTRSHGGWETLHATITTHDARVRTGLAEGGGMAQPGSWFG